MNRKRRYFIMGSFLPSIVVPIGLYGYFRNRTNTLKNILCSNMSFNISDSFLRDIPIWERLSAKWRLSQRMDETKITLDKKTLSDFSAEDFKTGSTISVHGWQVSETLLAVMDSSRNCE